MGPAGVLRVFSEGSPSNNIISIIMTMSHIKVTSTGRGANNMTLSLHIYETSAKFLTKINVNKWRNDSWNARNCFQN